MSTFKSNSAVIDCGSSTIRAGIAPERFPEIVFSNVIGYEGNAKNVCYIGDEVKDTKGRKQLLSNYPMEKGLVTNWDDMEKVWDHVIYKQLKKDPKDLPILMTQIPLLPEAYREKITEIMFEKFQIPSFYLAMQSVLALYATGKKEGLVYDSGDGVSHIVPVKDGFAIKDKIERLDFGGSDMTSDLQHILQSQNTQLNDRDIVQDIKETHCYVAADSKLELTKALQEKYQLPDGYMVRLGPETFQCPEVLFSPTKQGDVGVHKKINNVIMGCDVSLRPTLYKGIVLAGGGSTIRGFSSRLSKEISVLTATNIQIGDYSSPKDAAWIGGSILASLPDFASHWITRADYHESGAKIVHTKCA